MSAMAAPIPVRIGFSGIKGAPRWHGRNWAAPFNARKATELAQWTPTLSHV